MTNQEAIEILEHLKGVNPQSLHKPNEQIEAYNIAINALKRQEAWHEGSEVPQTPTFKVHDWVVDGDRVAIIYDLQKNGYVGHDVNRRDFVCRYSDESRLHLWSIADAKDGDVLADYADGLDNPLVFILKRFEHVNYGLAKPSDYSSYCFLKANARQDFLPGKYHHKHDIKPATKEQRDLLFAKMKEAGYEWDEKKKELKKTPVKPKFKAGDWLWHKEKGVFPVLIAGYDEERGYLAKYIGSESYFGRDATENEYRLWSIADAKDGDVLATDNIICIFKKLDKDGYYIISPCIYTVKDGLEVIDDEDDTIGSCGFKPATKEDRELLFRKMKEAGYEWDEKKKELLKIKHYAIANFKPKQWVLVRQGDGCAWRLDIFSNLKEGAVSQFECVGNSMVQCIPFDGNENLLGTTDPCDERYINW